MQRFKAKIRIVGVNPYVDVPGRVSRSFARRGYVPVTVQVPGGKVGSTLVPVGGGKHRLYINGQMRRLARVDVGDTVSIGVELDERSRMPTMPAGLAAELAKRPRARKVWEELTPSRRKEILRYLNFAKRRETQDRNVAKVVAILRSAEKEGVLSGIKIHGNAREGRQTAKRLG